MAYRSRTAWGARTRKSPTRLEPARVKGIALHWPGDKTRRTNVAQVEAALRAWQAQHIDDNGWSDIAYQVAVDQAGNTYSLRGLAYQSAANGSQTVNQQYGAVLLVLAVGEKPTAAMVAAVRRIVANHRRLFRNSTEIVPHSEIRPKPTDCPGDDVRALIKSGAFGRTRKAS